MNKYILKVMRYIDNPQAFTSEEMQANANASGGYLANAAAYAAHAANAYAVEYAAHAAAYADTYAYATTYAIDRFFKSTGEDKESYNNEVERLRMKTNKEILEDAPEGATHYDGDFYIRNDSAIKTSDIWSVLSLNDWVRTGQLKMKRNY